MIDDDGVISIYLFMRSEWLNDWVTDWLTDDGGFFFRESEFLFFCLRGFSMDGIFFLEGFHACTI